MATAKNTRPTKRQREVLTYVTKFIQQHGYGPSYREIKTALKYKAVSTVAAHVNNLISKGLLKKSDYGARSLEVVGMSKDFVPTGVVDPANEKWLIGQIETRVNAIKEEGGFEQGQVDNIGVLIESLRILGFEQAAINMKQKLNKVIG